MTQFPDIWSPDADVYIDLYWETLVRALLNGARDGNTRAVRAVTLLMQIVDAGDDAADLWDALTNAMDEVDTVLPTPVPIPTLSMLAMLTAQACALIRLVRNGEGAL